MRPDFRRSTMIAAALLAGLALATPARADRCDDLAKQLKAQVDGLKIGITAANIVYLSHPHASELSLGLPRPRFHQ